MDAMDVKLDTYIDAATDAQIFQGAEQVLKVIRPKWRSADTTYKMLSDGITNKLVRCRAKGGADNEAVLIRIYGNNTDILIDRAAETRNIRALNRFKMAPTLYATFANGLAYEYVPGSTLTPKTASNPEIYRLVAGKLAKLHKLQLPECATQAIDGKQPVLWRRLEKFVKLMPEHFSNEHVHKKLLNVKLSKAQILDEIDALKARLVRLNSPVVFCHNDLLLGNVIHTNRAHNGDAAEAVTFIDFEYADHNYQAFDLGNHFAEFAGVDDVDYGRYPSARLQRDWLRVYAEEFHATDGVAVTDAMLETLYVQANQFALASHLLWGAWALIQAEHSDIDFDFVRYAAIRWAEYFRRKDAFLALNLPADG